MNLKKTILIIEDDIDQQTIFATVLKRAGYSTIARDNALAGLSWLEQIEPDMILLDIMLPEMSGIEMLQRIRAAAYGKNVPVVIATASATLKPSDFEPYNIAGFLRKPLLPMTLVEKVNEVLG